MEKKFGIFNTVEELNRAAAAQKAEGDLEALIGLATENGLEKEDAEDERLSALVDERPRVTAGMGKTGRTLAPPCRLQVIRAGGARQRQPPR